MNPQAEALNVSIQQDSQVVFELLSEKGKKIFFPKKGILGQSAEAKEKKINATIGAAIEDDGSPMRLSVIEEKVDLDPSLYFPYAPSYGRPDIRKKWKEMLYEKNPPLNGKEISLPVVTNALTHGLSMAGYMFLNPGDTLIVSDLFWGNYNLIFANGYDVKIEKFKLFEGEKFNLASFRETLNKITGRKVLLLNFPNNPSGYTPTSEEMQEIINIIKTHADGGNKMVILTDDAYFDLVYEEGIEKSSAFAYLANLHENILAVKVDGPTKEDYVWGFRIGFISYGIKGGTTGLYDALAAKTAGAVRGNISNASNISQSLLLNAFNSDGYSNNKKEKAAILTKRYARLKDVLKDQKYQECFKAYPFNSGYFMCVQLAEGLDGEKIRKVLLDEYSTGIINMNNVFRLAFSSVAESDIPELVENIYQACKKA
jgi:aspartate/methionine/tyrosine aminotransferase